MNEFLLIAGLHFAAVIAPGQDFVWTVQQTLANGRKAGVYTALGVSLGILFYSILAVIGVQVILERFAVLFIAIKLIGALYLFYLGYLMFNSDGKIDIKEKSKNSNKTTIRYIKDGLKVNLSNVKAILFFIVLFTTVISPKTSREVLVFYGIWMSFVTFLWFSFIANIFGYSRIRARLLNYSYWIDKASGLIFITFSLIIMFYTLFK